MFFQNLRLHMTYFRNQRAALVEAASMVRQPVAAAWTALRDAVATDAGAGFAGKVDWTGQESEVLLLEKPLPGTAVIVAVDCGELTMVAVSLYLYGDAAVAEAAGKELTALLTDRFPAAEETT